MPGAMALAIDPRGAALRHKQEAEAEKMLEDFFQQLEDAGQSTHGRPGGNRMAALGIQTRN